MADHLTIRMVARADGSGYRRVSPFQFNMLKRHLVLEGVDGDEIKNIVTYWYARKVEE